MSKAGKRLLAAAQEAKEIAQGRKEPAGIFVPADINVRDIRRKLGLSQEDFAAEFCFTVTQIRDWEQGRSRPLHAARAYLMMIKVAPDTVRNILKEVVSEAEREVAA
ncbi:helix-turn-helix domain-containing protein [Citreicella sp. C3M06]|uniref:helix-turn-helix domain-containing protein n=1 Tax=Citreicella sp. C3M06 TaxID=2841564 RepID=UPI001C0A1B94|nr:helix-turn-helix domain-containing protein [Citreicella sp. C3M06]MBU2960477.1 helix-turn-helix domain-containing protein [Citreicella sp. C3M06]